MEYSLIITNTVKSGIQHRSGIIKTDISQQTFVLMKTSSRRLDEDEYILINHTSSEDVFKTSWSRPIYSSWLYIFKTSSRRFQDVFKTSSRHFQDVFKTSSRRFQDVFKASSRHLQDVFKTNHKLKLFLLTRL